jgi:hypothetical protein
MADQPATSDIVPNALTTALVRTEADPAVNIFVVRPIVFSRW